MIKVQSFNNFLGFGDGKYPLGEYVHSQGMNKSPNGIMPLWNAIASIDSDTLTDLGTPSFFTQATPASSTYVFHVDTAGSIFQNLNGVGAWALAYKPKETTYGNGLIGDQKGKLLYPMTRYLGKYDGTADYTTGTIAVTNGSPNIVGTGTTFTSGMVGRRIVIGGVWYTITSFTDATHIALTANYTGSTASGLSYAIKVGWNDQFKDFGASSLADDTDYRDSDTFEDWTVICNGNKLAVYNVTDDSFNASAFTLPSGFKTRSVKSGRTGLLAGANIGSRSILFLWDAQSDRSITPWIWLNGNIQAIKSIENGEWVVITTRQVLLTNGFTIKKLIPIPDNLITQSYLNVHPQGVEAVNDYVIIANNIANPSRMRRGYWIINLERLLWEYAPIADGGTFSSSTTMGAVFFDSSFRIHIGYTTNKPNKKVLGHLSNSTPTRAYLITEPLGKGNTLKVAEGVKLNLAPSPYQINSYPITFNVSVKIYDFKRSLWTYAQQKTSSSQHDRITVDGSVTGINNAEVGDEITIMEGANAGFVAHITSITGRDTSTEVWILDTSFSSDIESDVFIQVMPFKLVKKHPISSATELKDLYFNVKNRIKAQKYLLKISFDSISNVAPELLGGEFIYNDLGLLTSN
jgi:hypothetical protein